MKDDGKGRDEALERRRFLKGLGLAAGGAAGAAAVAVGVEGRAAADPRLRPGADTARAIAALEEALRLHDGLTGLSACVSESAREILSDPAEHIDWRLREAAETAHRATARAVEQDNSLSEDSAWFETQMNRVLTEQAAGKNRRRRL